MSLPEVWQKATEHSRAVEIKKIAVGISEEEIKDIRMERLPELGVMSSAEKATNIPIYENGLFSKPVQHEVIHTLYRVGADFYLNIYNGNKLNLEMEEEKTLHHIALIRKDQAISDIRYQAAALYLDLQKSVVFRDLIIQDIADQEKQPLQHVSGSSDKGASRCCAYACDTFPAPCIELLADRFISLSE